MWDFASIVDRSRKAAALVAQLEEALARDPSSTSVQVNLAASKKLAIKSNQDLMDIAKYDHVDICNYRLIPSFDRGFKIASISASMLEYQNLFSQVYDAKKNGAKSRASWGKEVEAKTALELAYTYSGSLGFVLFAHSDRDFFSGELDIPVDCLYEILDVRGVAGMRQIAQEYGGAVVKRLHDWSSANVAGGFSTDIRWSRSDGRELGKVCDIRQLEEIAITTVETSDEKTSTSEYVGMLVGGDLSSRTFHFTVPNGADLRGSLAPEFPEYIELNLGRTYKAVIRETMTVVYATGREDIKRELINLTLPPREPHVSSH